MKRNKVILMLSIKVDNNLPLTPPVILKITDSNDENGNVMYCNLMEYSIKHYLEDYIKRYEEETGSKVEGTVWI